MGRWARAMDAAAVAAGAAATVTIAGALRRLLRGGPHWPPLEQRAMGFGPAVEDAFRFEVPTCAPALTGVLDEFKRGFAAGLQAEAQLCVYHRGERVWPLSPLPCQSSESTRCRESLSWGTLRVGVGGERLRTNQHAVRSAEPAVRVQLHQAVDSRGDCSTRRPVRTFSAARALSDTH